MPSCRKKLDALEIESALCRDRIVFKRITNMKASRWFNRNRLSSLVRMASAVTLMSAAAAMAFVAVKPVGPYLLGGSDIKHPSNKLRQDRDASFGNRLAMPGPERDGTPTAAAEEEYAHRAYPAAYVPFKL